MTFFLFSCRVASADNPNAVTSFGMDNDNKTTTVSVTNQDETIFIFGMKWIGDRER